MVATGWWAVVSVLVALACAGIAAFCTRALPVRLAKTLRESVSSNARMAEELDQLKAEWAGYRAAVEGVLAEMQIVEERTRRNANAAAQRERRAGAKRPEHETMAEEEDPHFALTLAARRSGMPV